MSLPLFDTNEVYAPRVLKRGELKLFLAVQNAASRVRSMRDMETFLNSIWDWQMFQDAKCWGETKISPMDLDAVVERNGYFLVIESKRVGTAIPGGQKITFEGLVWCAPVTIVVVWGNPRGDCVDAIEVWTRGSVRRSPRVKNIEATKKNWLGYCERWFLWADRQREFTYLGPTCLST